MMIPVGNPAPPVLDAQHRLIEAAQEEFAEHGFDGATIREICRKANANVASINYYFGGKEGLYIEAVKQAHQCAARMDQFPLPVPGAPPVEKLRLFIREMVARMHAPASPKAMKLMMREMADPGMAANVVVKEFIQPLANYLQAILIELLPDIDEPRRLATGFSIIGQILYYRQNRPVSELIFGKDALNAISADLVTQHITQFTLAALGLAKPMLPRRRKH